MLHSTQRLNIEEAPLARGRRISLLFTWGDQAQAASLRTGQALVVGRAQPSQFVIAHPSLSRTHARLVLGESELSLEDLGSTNGCIVNGVRCQRATIAEGDVVQLGSVELIVCALPQVTPVQSQLSHAAFMQHVHEEVAQARALGRGVTVLALRHASSLAPALVEALTRGSLDRMCAFAPGVSLVLLADQDGAAARTWAKQFATAERVLGLGLASYPGLPCGADELVERAIDAARTAKPGTVSVASARDSTERDESVVVRAPAMIRLYELAARAARASLPVLVQGETGSGKELVAKALHDQGPRSKAPFRALNCAAIPPNLVEGILFGHERGAFTGAERQSQGIFEQAEGGTVFLDEVAELSLPAQAALLRVLEERRIVRVGGQREIEVDVRVVAATHRQLEDMVAAQTFREDLMYRLDALTLQVPPLRERREEILPLAALFLARASRAWTSTASRLSSEAGEALLAYAWPGNVRQLKNVIERSVVVCQGEEIALSDLPSQIVRASVREPQAGPDAAASAEEGPLPARVRAFEIACIKEALAQAQGNQAEAARILGVPRKTLATKVHTFGLLPRECSR